MVAAQRPLISNCSPNRDATVLCFRLRRLGFSSRLSISTFRSPLPLLSLLVITVFSGTLRSCGNTMVFSSALIALAILLYNLVEAQVVQDDWLRPALPDFSSSLTLGTNYTIRWTQKLYNWFPNFAPDADVENVDLWLKSSLSPRTLPIQCQWNRFRHTCSASRLMS